MFYITIVPSLSSLYLSCIIELSKRISILYHLCKGLSSSIHELFTSSVFVLGRNIFILFDVSHDETARLGPFWSQSSLLLRNSGLNLFVICTTVFQVLLQTHVVTFTIGLHLSFVSRIVDSSGLWRLGKCLVILLLNLLLRWAELSSCACGRRYHWRNIKSHLIRVCTLSSFFLLKRNRESVKGRFIVYGSLEIQ